MNKEMIAVNQDSLGIQARKFMDMGEHEIWAKELSEGRVAVCFLNREDHAWDLNYDWKKQTMYFLKNVNIRKNTYNVRDVWAHKYLAKTDDTLKNTIPAHGVLMVVLDQKS